MARRRGVSAAAGRGEVEVGRDRTARSRHPQSARCSLSLGAAPSAGRILPAVLTGGAGDLLFGELDGAAEPGGRLRQQGVQRHDRGHSAAIRSPLMPLAIRSPTVWSMFRQYSNARASTGSVTPFLRWPTTLETSRSRWASSMTLRTRVPA